MTDTLTVDTIDRAMLENIPHNAQEFENTGGGIYNLVVHTMANDNPDNLYDYGPEVHIGAFAEDGTTLDEFVSVWSEDDYQAGRTEQPIDCTTVEEVVAAVWTIIRDGGTK